MNKYALLHLMDSNYAFPLSKNEFVLRLRTQKNDDIDSVTVLYNDKYAFPQKHNEKKMELAYSDSLFDYYEVTLFLSDPRLAYVFRLSYKGKESYFSEDGLTEGFDFKTSYYNFFQYAYINKADVIPVPEWTKKAVFYQIFPDRFCKGDMNKDASYITIKWGDKPTRYDFAGGDLKGVISKLDYLKDLGINAIYMTPIFLSSSYHKYDIIDYYQIDPQLGSEDDLHELVKEAHSKGVKIVLDAVFNHCSNQSPLFKDVIVKGTASKYYKWFIIHGDKPDMNNPNYEMFASCNYMPKFDTSNPEVIEYLLAIGEHYVRDFDIDGWRLDVSDEVSHDFWREFRRRIKAIKSDAMIIGENWHDSYSYLQGDQFDSVMNYPFTKACIDFFASRSIDACRMSDRLNALLTHNKEQVNKMMLNLLDSHDTDRIFTDVKENKNILLCAYALLFMSVGMPCLYYGSEIPLPGLHDPDSRRCFAWDELDESSDFFQTIKKLITLRQEEAVNSGSVRIDAEGGLLRLSRFKNGQTLTLLINMENKPIRIKKTGEVITGHNCREDLINSSGFIIFRE